MSDFDYFSCRDTKSSSIPILNTANKDTPSVFVIIPVYNRKALTLKCLARIASQDDLDHFQFVIVDDGSTDGTVDAIRTQYPLVHILHGDGNQWWTGSIKLGMEYAYIREADYFVWLNDDTLLDKGTIEKLVNLCSATPKCIVAGQCYSITMPEKFTYGGFSHHWLRHEPIHAPPGALLSCDSINGNIVCLPRSVIQDIGYPPADKAPHYHGETIYSWQAKKKGYSILLSGDAIAHCNKNPGDERWFTSDLSVFELWGRVRSPKSPFYIPAFWNFCITLWGMPGIWLFLQPYFRLSLISLARWLLPKRMYSRKSSLLFRNKLNQD